MTFTEETLIGYVDREVDAGTAAAIEAALAQDPSLAERIERHRRLRAAVHAAYAPTLDEPLPAHLLALTRDGGAAAPPAPASNVIDLDAARAAQTEVVPRRRDWRTWGALAASLALGVWIGGALPNRPFAQRELFATTGGIMVARDGLARALDEQLASTQADRAPVRIGLSFLANGGGYCRTFVLSDAKLAGLGCKMGSDWQIHVLARTPSEGAAANGYRTAGSAMPGAVLRSVEESIRGDPLDAGAERAAQLGGWRN